MESGERLTFSKEIINQMLSKCFEEECEALSISLITAGHFNTSFDVRLPDRNVVVRIAPPQDDRLLYYEKGMMIVEAFLHPLIRLRTDIPIPEILIYDDSHEIIPRDYIIMEKMPGRNMSEVWFSLSVRQRERVCEQLGRFVKRLHQITGEYFGYVWPNNVMEGSTDWHTALLTMLDKILEDNLRAGSYTQRECDRLKRAFDRNMYAVDKPQRASLLHMDLWHQNILLDDSGEVTAILDIDRAVWGPPELEFAVLDTYGLSTDAFFSGYGEERDTSPEAQIRRAMYIILEIIKYPFIRTVRNNDYQSARAYKEEIERLVETYLE